MRWIMGYIECQVPGGHLERFMNLCRHHEIELWKVKEREKQAVFFMYAAEYSKLRPLARKNKDGSAYSEKMRISFLVSESQTGLDLYVGNRSFFCGFVHPFPFCMGHSIPRTADLYQRRIGGGD